MEYIVFGDDYRFDIFDILEYFLKHKRTGKLHFIQGLHCISLWVREGNVVQASSPENFGVDALYQLMMQFTQGSYAFFHDEIADFESFSKDFETCLNEYYFIKS